MVKKWALSFLTLLYMTVSSGFAMKIHYCMGERMSAGLYSGDNEKCGRCGMKNKKGGCCNDEVKLIKLSDAYKHVINDNNIPPSVIISTVNPGFKLLKQHANPVKKGYAISKFFDPSESPLYIRNCVFLI